jgi:hypothetical protein
VTTLLPHFLAAELLFAAGTVPQDQPAAADLIRSQYRAHHGNPATFADELAQEYARHPASAAAHMTACLALAPDSVEVPDFELPDRDPDGALYTGMGDDRG